MPCPGELIDERRLLEVCVCAAGQRGTVRVMDLELHLDERGRWRDELAALVVTVDGDEYVAAPLQVPDPAMLGASSTTVRWFLTALTGPCRRAPCAARPSR